MHIFSKWAVKFYKIAKFTFIFKKLLENQRKHFTKKNGNV